MLLYPSNSGFEGKWYELESAVRLTADPPYVHRVLFPLAARGVLATWHALSVKKAFLLTQLVTLLLLVTDDLLFQFSIRSKIDCRLS
jgi:hypothetical protein